MKKAMTVLLAIAGMAMLAAVLMPAGAGAQAGGEVRSRDQNRAPTAQQNNQQPNERRAATGAYQYTAQPGDSYSVLARKAVQTYGLETKTNLSGAQIIFAETNLTKEAGSPLLRVGQRVSLERAAVQKWVDQAKQLTPAQQAAWNRYVPLVNFNTNAYGED